MIKTISFIVLICSVIVTDSLAQNSFNPGEIISLEGELITGEIDISKLENGLILFRTEGGNFQELKADDVKKVAVFGGIQLVSLIIKYGVTNSEIDSRYFFTEPVYGEVVQLEKVYGASFDYALTKFEESKALQIFKIQVGSRQQTFESYKGVFYEMFRGCLYDVETEKIRFNRTNFVRAIKNYEKCNDSDYHEAKRRVWEFEIEYGTNQVDFDLEVKHVVSSFPDVFVSNYKTSKENFYSFYGKRFIYEKMVLIGTGVSLREYIFQHSNRENQRDVDNFSHKEVIVPFFLEGRVKVKKLSASMILGMNFHNVSFKDADQIKRGDQVRELNNESGTAYTGFNLYQPNEYTEDYFTPLARVTFSVEMAQRFDLGISYSIDARNKEVYTANYARADEKFSKEILMSVFFRFRI